MVIDQLISNTEKVDFAEVISESIDQTRKNFQDEQIDQLRNGKNANGELIGKYRNPKYAQMKHLMNPAAGLGNVDGRLTGSFYQGIIIDVRASSVVVESDDSKNAALQEKYKGLLGLGGEYKDEYIKEFMGPASVENIQNKILSS